MNNELTSPSLTSETSHDDVLFEAQRLAVPRDVSAREMLVAAALHENHPTAWLKELGAKPKVETASTTEPAFATSTEPFYEQTKGKEQSNTGLTVEQAIGRIGYIGGLLDEARNQEELTAQG